MSEIHMMAAMLSRSAQEDEPATEPKKPSNQTVGSTGNKVRSITEALKAKANKSR